MTTFSKLFADRARNLSCKDVLHPDFESCSSFLWSSVHASTLQTLKHLGPIFLIPLALNFRNATFDECKEKAATYLKMSFGISGVVSLSFAMHCLLYKLNHKIRFFNISAVPMAISSITFVNYLPPKFVNVQFILINDLLVQSILRTSDFLTFKIVRESRILSTTLFMVFSSLIMGLKALTKDENRRYWYAENLEGKRSKNDSDDKLNTDKLVRLKHLVYKQMMSTVKVALFMSSVKIILNSFRLLLKGRIPEFIVSIVHNFDYKLLGFFASYGVSFQVVNFFLNELGSKRKPFLAGFLAGTSFYISPRYFLFTYALTTLFELLMAVTLNQSNDRLSKVIKELPWLKIFVCISMPIFAHWSVTHPWLVPNLINEFIRIFWVDRWRILKEKYDENINRGVIKLEKRVKPMIPWMREKIAERRAKWEASRKRDNFSSETIGVSDKIPLQKDVSYESIEIFSGESTADNVILLNIISYDGRLVNLRVMTTLTIEELKNRAVTELFRPVNNERDTSAINYKLLKQTENMLELNESLTIDQNNISDCDELLLLKCGNNEAIVGKPVQRGPSQIVIDKFTVDRIACGERAQSIVDVNEIMLRCDVQNDIRQLLISLAKSSAFVIGAGPFATQIILMFKEKLIRRNGNDLYQFDGMPHLFVQRTLKLETDGKKMEPKAKFLELNDQFNETRCWNSTMQESTKKNIEILLEIIRVYAYKRITTKSNLKEIIWKMGFSKDDVVDALKQTDNDYANACKWLMRTHKNYNDGLLKDSPMLKALTISPHIQLSFSSPKIFIAYLSILDNYSSINLWLSDAETAGVIGHILRVYHEEKHILAINQIS